MPMSVTPARVCQAIRFWGASNAIARCRSTSSSFGVLEPATSSLRRILPGVHAWNYTADIFLAISIVVHDFEQHTMLTSAHGGTGALSMGPSDSVV
jgi:hypothetical protein